MSFSSLTKGISPKICRLCVRIINKRSCKPFMCLDQHWTELSRPVWAGIIAVSRTSVWFRFGSPLSSKVVVCGHCFVMCPSQLMKHENGSYRCPYQVNAGVVRVVAASVALLGGPGGVVNSLDFCPASLKSLGCFYFWCVFYSQWKAVTVNLRILHCQL